MSLRVALQPAYLLHSRPFRDSSRLLEVFTLDHGRLGLLARGTARRRRGGALSALLQPFRPLLLTYTGRGELPTLQSVEIGGELATLHGERLFSALYLNELLARLLHRHEAHPLLFARYAETLAGLAGEAPVAALLRRFEFALLDDLGYGIDLRHDAVSGAPVDPQGHYLVDPERGLVPAQSVAEAVTAAYPGRALLAVAGGDVDGESGSTARALARILLNAQLGPEPLRSRALFKRARARADGSAS